MSYEQRIREIVHKQVDAVLDRLFAEDAALDGNLRETLRAGKRVALSAALRASDGNRKRAAALLGLSRGGFYMMCRRAGLPLTPKRVNKAKRVAA